MTSALAPKKKTRVLYVGVTNDLARRAKEHRQGLIAGFTRKYRTCFGGAHRTSRLALRLADVDTNSRMKRGAHKILIIDDDKTVVSTISAVLRAAGYQVVSALDPVQGFMAARREKPQVIVLDLMMPAGGGMQLLGKLISTGKAPVVVMTLLTDPKTEAEARASGAAAFLTKPVNPESLKEAIEELLPAP